MTCGVGLAGRHVRCRGCDCSICCESKPKQPSTQRRRPERKQPRKPRTSTAPRRARKPRQPGAKPGPQPMTEDEEAEVRQMVLKLVERIVDKVSC